jgi:hypothetical protein
VTERRLRGGRRIYGKAGADGMPDPSQPCPDCGKEWDCHGNFEIARLA